MGCAKFNVQHTLCSKTTSAVHVCAHIPHTSHQPHLTTPPSHPALQISVPELLQQQPLASESPCSLQQLLLSRAPHRLQQLLPSPHYPMIDPAILLNRGALQFVINNDSTRDPNSFLTIHELTSGHAPLAASVLSSRPYTPFRPSQQHSSSIALAISSAHASLITAHSCCTVQSWMSRCGRV